MDPNAALAEFRQKMKDASEIGERLEIEGESNELLWKRDDLWSEAAQLMESLDEWLSKGGFLPDAWSSDLSKRIAANSLRRVDL